jgi:hypothetical protein
MMFESNTALRSFYSISTLKIQIHVEATTSGMVRTFAFAGASVTVTINSTTFRRPVITMTIISEEELRERLNGLIR